MLNKLKKHISEHELLAANDRLLLTVSGGKDSVCMLHLFAQLDYPLAVAHCNFSLRGKESDEDERFVEHLAKQYNLSFFKQRFDTQKYAQEKGLSTQMAARELRYAWFQELGFDKVATAHHQDDNIETLLIKKSRKASLEGLCGIPLKNENIIRPLLCFSTKEVENYLKIHNWTWREDASNASVDYQRNEIRLRQLPMMEKENPNIRQELLLEIATNQKRYQALQKEVARLHSIVWKEHVTHSELLLDKLFGYPQKEEVMYELLKKYGPFPWQDVFALSVATSGKEIQNERYRLVKDRSSILLIARQKGSQLLVKIDGNTTSIDSPVSLAFSVLDKEELVSFVVPSSAALDFSKLSFPLTLRKWQEGDVFVPLGMKGRKKVSDFMIDEKFSILQKENTWILCSNDEIVWVVGHRLDDRYKLVAQTEKVYLVQPLKIVK